MKTHTLIQGSSEWHAYRAQHFNASDCPAMMGCSPYQTRSQLLHKLHTGMTADVDAATQRKFDDGHRFEALARPLAEEFIGQALYPVVGSEGELSASFDGLTMDETICFEHKTLNAELRECMEGEDESNRLPLHYRAQMEQQLMVSGAEKCLFMASNWDRDTLIEERHCWYYSDPELRAQIIAGWEQFAQDLVDFKPEPVTVEAVGRTPETLPALHIEVTGMVTASNLQEYKEHALAVFASINRDLKTDQDFADARKAVKWCADIESRIKAAKAHAMSQTESLDTLFRTMDDIGAECKRVRLEVDGLVKTRDSTLRAEIVAGGRDAFNAHIDALNVRLGKNLMPTTVLNFAGVIKGMSKFDNMRDAVATELARLKIEANATADKIQSNINAIAQAGHDFLFADSAILVQKDPEFVAMAIKNRVSEHAAKEAARIEEERARIRAEEQAKAEREAREKLAQEQAEAARVAADAAKVARIVTAPDVAPVKMIAPEVGRVQPVKIIEGDKPALIPNLSLGEISTRLGFNVTSAFLSSLGFEATTVRAAKLYHSDDFQAICEAIKVHVGGVQDQYEAATA